ncbi:MAG: TetR/AcrR family transcriptional regulator [Hydrogenophaga sp.]|nr:TetR/AcrR family transcriptional regulator [Hydrogenophaga sp.]
MSVKFDAITPVLSPEQVKLQQQRQSDRRRRQERLSEERRQQLLDTAWWLWQEVGAQGFNMRELAQRAGYTAGALYAYFPGRDAILTSLQQRVIDDLAALVQEIKVPKADRNGRNRRDTVTSAMQARTVFVERSLAWWSSLADEPKRLQLVLHGGHGLPEDALGAGSTPVMLARLAEALQPCLDALLAAGLTEELAQQIHDEVLAYGLGLLVLMGPSASGARATLEPRFLQSLQRWLDMALVAVQGPAGTAAETAQADLFGAA